MKYPVYDLVPTGPRLDGILRHKTEILSPIEIQKIFSQNRRDYETELTKRLNSGEWVVAEDYVGTGIAWGMTNGVPKEDLETMNKGLIGEDLALCMIGQRFESAIESGHLHEDGGNWNKNKEIHIELAKEKGWKIVDANGSIDDVHDRMIKALEEEM
jgi:thymidylate kinase